MSIEENVKALQEELAKGNCFGEKVTLVAATKTRTAEEIQRAINSGIEAVGENKVQEFQEKFPLISGARRHFIGHLQTNKVKYLIGKVDLYHSLDRDVLAEELSKRSQAADVVSNVLVQINIGSEESKGGYPLSEGYEAYRKLKQTGGIRVKGFMAMLPLSNDEVLLRTLCKQMRALYERVKAEDDDIEFLSMGMSGDWKLCLEHGSNMIRLGTAIFGGRNYPVK